MNDKKKSKKGGARPGSGRPTDRDEAAVAYPLRLTPSQIEKVKALGGAEWIRQKIDKAKLPDIN